MPAVLSNHKNDLVAFLFHFRTMQKRYGFSNSAETVLSEVILSAAATAFHRGPRILSGYS